MVSGLFVNIFRAGHILPVEDPCRCPLLTGPSWGIRCDKLVPLEHNKALHDRDARVMGVVIGPEIGRQAFDIFQPFSPQELIICDEEAVGLPESRFASMSLSRLYWYRSGVVFLVSSVSSDHNTKPGLKGCGSYRFLNVNQCIFNDGTFPFKDLVHPEVGHIYPRIRALQQN
jgi:hypothetical protein